MKFSLSDLDPEPIKQAILSEKVTDFYADEALRLTEDALQTYAETDAKSERIVTVEQKFEESLDFWPYKFEWVADKISVNPSLIIVDDWKTTKKPLGKKYDADQWAQRLDDSWQWRLYIYFLKRRFPKHNFRFRYRGISVDRDSPCRELVISSESSYFNAQIAKVETYLRLQAKAIEGWISEDRWPEYRSSGCFAYGRECPEIVVCSTTGNEKGLVQIDHLSHSFLEKVVTCPERARMGKLKERQDEDKSLTLGKAVHAALAVAYLQIQQAQIAQGFNNGKELPL